MAFSDTDLATLERAIASGVTEVRFADGRTVKYQDVASLMRARDTVRSELAAVSATPPPRFTRIVHVRT